MEKKSSKNQQKKKKEIKITGLNIDKAEYQQIVLSNSNFPDKNFYGKSE